MVVPINKLLAGLFFLLFMLPVFAECPFSDQFTVVAPASVKILDVQTAGNLRYENQTDASFTLACANNDILATDSGLLSISIGEDASNRCQMTILDGPYEENPTITAVLCEGRMHYISITHSFGTYKYTLNFS